MRRSLRCLASGASVLAFVVATSIGCDSTEPGQVGGQEKLVAVIGDSYMAGFGVTQADQGMAVKLAEDLDMKLANFAVGGTGYITGGMSGTQSFGVQADSALATGADLYIVEGAVNDWAAIYQNKVADLDTFTAAVGTLFRQLAAGAGDADVVIVGPIWPGGFPDAGILAIRDILQAQAADAGLTFVDPLAEEWVTPDNTAEFIGPDLVHPNEAGHAYIAERIAEAIEGTG